MDRFGDYIGVVLKGVHTSTRGRKDLEEEIRDHLEMVKKELSESGYKEKEAELMAIKRFGEDREINRKYRSIYTPFRRVKDIINEKKVIRESLQWTASIMGALVISLFIRSYVFATTEVKQCSMQNTLFEGQKLIELKVDYYFSKPKRGDIVIINQEPENGAVNVFLSNVKEFIQGFTKKEDNEVKRLIKRVVGVPGDEIDVRDGKIYLNGQLFNEPYVKGATFPRSMTFPIKVPENSYFVLGDNRENSMDSRDLGFISAERIEGKAVLRLWPFDKFGSISD